MGWFFEKAENGKRLNVGTLLAILNNKVAL
jgi:hypothetical protein